MRKFSDSHVKNPEVLHLSSAGLQSLSPRHHNPKGLCSPSLLYMQSSDYCTGYKLCYFLHLTKKTAHSWKGDLSGPQLHSLREKIAHLTLPGSNWFQLRDDGQSRPYLFGHVWGQELIEFWDQSLSLFCTWLCMQSILMSACVVYLPFARSIPAARRCAPRCGSRLSLFCRFDQPESIFFAFCCQPSQIG